MCSEQDPLFHFQRLQMRLFVCLFFFFFHRKNQWSQGCCHGNNIDVVLFVMYISGAKV